MGGWGKKGEVLAPTLWSRAHFLVELDILDNFKREGEIAEQDVYAQEPDEAEVAQHVVERQRAIITHNFAEIDQHKVQWA
jgi:hypothetical protein